jgi:uncharacterized protein (TIGR02757 family)
MENTRKVIRDLACKYNKEEYFRTDPLIFPKHFALLLQGKEGIFNDVPIPETISLKDVEIAGIIAAHLAWGRRDMIVRDTKRAMDEMNWNPYDYIQKGIYRDHDTSLHRTIKWSEFAKICSNLKKFYTEHQSLEELSAEEIREQIYGAKRDPKCANKKIHMFRRWMIRNDGIVDLGLWKKSSPAELVIPLDVHVHRSALNLGITKRKSADINTAKEITEYLKEVFPNDPCIGDFALFAHAATIKENK